MSQIHGPIIVTSGNMPVADKTPKTADIKSTRNKIGKEHCLEHSQLRGFLKTSYQSLLAMSSLKPKAVTLLSRLDSKINSDVDFSRQRKRCNEPLDKMSHSTLSTENIQQAIDMEKESVRREVRQFQKIQKAAKSK